MSQNLSAVNNNFIDLKNLFIAATNDTGHSNDLFNRNNRPWNAMELQN